MEGLFLDRLSISLQSHATIGMQTIFSQTIDMFNVVRCPVHDTKNL